MRRQSALLTTLALTVGGFAVTAAPAWAASATIDSLDATAAGAASGAVTTDAAVVKVFATDGAGGIADAVTLSTGVTPETPSATVEFDLTTWGLGAALLRVETCEADESGCVEAATQEFTATESAPTITWPDTTTQTTTDYTLSATDTGGGVLVASPSNVSYSAPLLAKDGTPLTLDLETDGTQTVTVLRCNDAGYTVCHALDSRTVTVDRTAPAIAAYTKSGTSIYPTVDGYQDGLRFRVRPAAWDATDVATFEVRDDSGAVVRTLTPTLASATEGYLTSWNGRGEEGAVLAAGTYTVAGILTDAAGNAVEQTAAVELVLKHLVAKTFIKSVTPSTSYAQQFVGRCSFVSRPSKRAWAGSFGLYSNAKCSDGLDASVAETQHGMFVPKAARYGNFKVAVYGGAATAKPSSTLNLVYLGKTGTWAYNSLLSSGLGNHQGPTRDGNWAVHDQSSDQPFVYWGNYTSKSRRYDVKHYTVTLDYQVLVAD